LSPSTKERLRLVAILVEVEIGAAALKIAFVRQDSSVVSGMARTAFIGA
jgi:hypothetical protein